MGAKERATWWRGLANFKSVSDGHMTTDYQLRIRIYLEKECNDVAVCRVWRCGRSWLVRSPKTRHGMNCCCAHALLPAVGDAVKVGGRRATILKGLDIRYRRLWRRGERTLWIGPLSLPCTSPRTCNELGDVCAPPSCYKGSEKPSHDATCSLLGNIISISNSLVQF